MAAEGVRAAALVVINPSGNRSRIPLEPLPFHIGRQAENHLVLRDNRASRTHARIVEQDGEYFVEDLDSLHGVWVNGVRSQRQQLRDSDRIEFGVRDSYQLIFSLEEVDLHRILDQFGPPKAAIPGGGNLAKLRALVEVARALQSSLPIEEVLAAVVDAALAVTGCERGFLMLLEEGDLRVRVARDRNGRPIPKSDLNVPARLINHALAARRDLLSMNFDPLAAGGVEMDASVASLELRSVVCVPLVRVRAGGVEETHASATLDETAGLLYMDSRGGSADLSYGNRELLQTLALEASTVLENARLLEQERTRRRLEAELELAREIQTSLLPRSLPEIGWMRMAGSSIPSHQVGGDFFDVRPLGPDCWQVLVADVSGKGVGSALLASLLQGAFLAGSEGAAHMEEAVQRANGFLLERTRGEKYATVFCCSIDSAGCMRYVNAGHCPPLVVKPDGKLKSLDATGFPAGLLETAAYQASEIQLEAADKLVIFSDGVTEAANAAGELLGLKRVKTVIREHASAACSELHAALAEAVDEYTLGTVQGDDITLVVLEYRPD